MRIQNLLFIACFLSFQTHFAQETFPVNGVHDDRQGLVAFTNATIHIKPGEQLERGTLIIRDGKIEAAGQGISIPKGAIVKDCTGKHIYASFIELSPGFRKPKKKTKTPEKKGKTTTQGHWNPAIQPEYQHEQAFPLNKKLRDDWLASGFGVLNFYKNDGIMRGSSQLAFSGVESANEAVIIAQAANQYSFHKGTSKEPYPSSLMGAIALIRQTFYDAQWYASEGSENERNGALEAIYSKRELPSIFQLHHPLSWRNIIQLSEEFQMDFIVDGTGREYKLEVPAGARIIAPLTFPKHYDVSDPLIAQYVSTSELLDWHNAPCNASLLIAAGHQVALSRDSLRSSRQFFANLHQSMRCGLTHDQALQALTMTPAAFIGVEEDFGSLELGKSATFIVADRSLATSGFRVWQHWNAGQLVYESMPNQTDVAGRYSLVVDSKSYNMTVRDDEKGGFRVKLKGKNKTDSGWKVTLRQERELITMVLRHADSANLKTLRLSGKISLNGGVWDGRGQDETGRWFAWSAIRSKEKLKASQPDAPIPITARLDAWPLMSFGLDSLPDENTFVITNAVVWTSTDTGILEDGDVYVVNGIIKQIGQDILVPTEVRRINANGRHLTPGIIDEHSHIAIRSGVNEGAQASSAEVRIMDAIDPWDSDIFRHLAGGVTTVQLLHGSANPIGGQSAIIKLRWGQDADGMVFQEAPGFIKFALGENVKRSNAKNPRGRFPLTRMGVEQVYVDHFTRAREYQLRKLGTTSSPSRRKRGTEPSGTEQRMDLELEALGEILDGTRFISCHSYVQSEINMLMHVGDSMGFKVNTFTHILEGYKVADKLKTHGANASTFSDWWAYKFEVNDAIPWNAALLTKAGVNTAINSDDAEMGRRLNQEAAKTVKYGGLSPEEAFKTVTINPAKMLHLDEWVGSIEVGKQADLALWSSDPLSVYTKVDLTFIDGYIYFDRRQLPALQKRDNALRAELLAMMLKASSGSPGKKPRPHTKHPYHCDTEIENYAEE